MMKAKGNLSSAVTRAFSELSGEGASPQSGGGLCWVRLTSSLFIFETLPPFRVQGKREPGQVYRLVGIETTKEKRKRSTSIGWAQSADPLLSTAQRVARGLFPGQGPGNFFPNDIAN